MLRKLVLLLFFIVFSEPFGDSILMNSFENLFGLDVTVFDSRLKNGIIFLFCIIFLFSIKLNSKINVKLFIPVFGIILVYLFGLVWGIINNSPLNAFNEVSSIFPLFLVFSLSKHSDLISTNCLNNYMKWIIGIVFIKYLIYQFLFFVILDGFAWKILMKQSVIVLFPFVYFVRKLFKHFSFNLLVLILLSMFIVIIAQARTLLISSFFLFIIVVFNSDSRNILKNVSNSLLLFTIFFTAFVIYLFTQDILLSDSMAYLFSGENASESVSFRKMQTDEIFSRITDSPYLGKGFGYFNPNYSTYSQFAKPYLLEMDLFNFVSKIGIFMTIIYFISYFILYYFISKIRNNENRVQLRLYFWVLISFLIYSLGQTLHQSYIYWFCFAIVYSSVVYSLKSEKL